jgi:hypothetical protein
MNKFWLILGLKIHDFYDRIDSEVIIINLYPDIWIIDKPFHVNFSNQ